MSDSPNPFKKPSPAGTSQGKPAPATPLTPRRRGIIVGASDGIGAVLAQKLAKEGYNLALIARRKDKLITLCNEINRPLNETRTQDRCRSGRIGSDRLHGRRQLPSRAEQLQL